MVMKAVFEFFRGIFSTFKCTKCFFVFVDLSGPTSGCETSVSELPLLFAIGFFLIEICISSDSRNSSETEWLTCKQWPLKINTTKQRIYLIYLRI